jgi:hypothetical protein
VTSLLPRSAKPLLTLFFGLAIASVACKEDDPDYPRLQDGGCVGVSCSGGAVSQGGGKGGTSAAGGASGAGASGGSAGDSAGAGAGDGGSAGSVDDGTTATVRGQVVVLADALFLAGSPYPGTATVVVDQASPTPTGSWDGVTPFEIAGVPGGARLFATTPVSATADLLGSLVRYQVTPPSFETNFPLVDGQVLRTVVASLPTPQTLAAGTSHALVTVTNSAGEAIQGVTATVSGAGAIAYDLGDDYSGTKTGTRGTILVVNIVGAGQVNLVLTDLQGQQASTALPIQPDVVTFAGVQF